MAILNYTVQELIKIKNNTVRSFDNDIHPLFVNSQKIGKQRGLFHFGIIKGVMSYIEVCGAIYCGWQERNRSGQFDTRKVSTSDKAIAFIEDIMGKIDNSYKKNGRLFYIMYRHGSTHLLRPHRIKSLRTGDLFSWRWYSGGRQYLMSIKGGVLIPIKHLKLIKVLNEYELPVSMECICNDTKKAIKNFFDELIKLRKLRRLPMKQRRVLTFIAEGIVERGDV